MYIVKAKSLISEWKHDYLCKTLEEANEWVAKQQAKKKHWGRFRGAGEFSKSELDRKGYDESLVVSSRNDEDGIEYITLSTDYYFEIINLNDDPIYVQEERIKERVEIGKAISAKFIEQFQNYIVGHNTLSGATKKQIDDMLVDFAPIYKELQEIKPKEVKKLLKQASAKGVITDEVKEDLLYILKEVSEE